MPDPVTFSSATARTGLPYLFPGQSQKEFTVNEAFGRIDALLHCTIDGEANAPSPSPAEGDCWLVGDAPTGAWADQAGRIACRQSGTWLFVTPVAGMRAYDRESGGFIRFDGTWQRPESVTAPVGGSTVDSEARAAIAALVSELVTAGVLPEA